MKLIRMLLPSVALASKYQFQPETQGISAGGLDMIPGFFNLSTSLTKSNLLPTGADSFWTASFVQTYNGHEYMVITHMAVFQGQPTTSRGAVFDVTLGSGYTSRTNTSSNFTVYDSVTGVFNASASGGDFLFGCLNSSDPTSRIHTSASVPQVQYDITFNGTSPALLNAGTGAYQVANSSVYEWAIPAAPTTGFLVVNGTKRTIDSAKSITWFDRQFGGATGLASSWHWWLLFIEVDGQSSRIPMSVWDLVDSVNGNKSFASIREQPGVQKLAPILSVEASSTRTWTSSQSNVTYNLDWTIVMAGGTNLQISIVTGDQEITTTTGASIVYEGFLTVSGTYQGKKATGYGLMEVVP